jgi:hypothetical protein
VTCDARVKTHKRVVGMTRRCRFMAVGVFHVSDWGGGYSGDERLCEKHARLRSKSARVVKVAHVDGQPSRKSVVKPRRAGA